MTQQLPRDDDGEPDLLTAFLVGGDAAVLRVAEAARAEAAPPQSPELTSEDRTSHDQLNRAKLGKSNSHSERPRQ